MKIPPTTPCEQHNLHDWPQSKPEMNPLDSYTALAKVGIATRKLIRLEAQAERARKKLDRTPLHLAGVQPGSPRAHAIDRCNEIAGQIMKTRAEIISLLKKIYENH